MILPRQTYMYPSARMIGFTSRMNEAGIEMERAGEGMQLARDSDKLPICGIKLTRTRGT